MRSHGSTLSQARRAVLTALALSGVRAVLLLAAPLLALQVFEQIIPTRNSQTLMQLGLIAVAIVVAYATIELVRDTILLRAALWLDHVLGQELFEGAMRRDEGDGDGEQDATAALSQVRNFLTGPAIRPLLDAPWTPVYLMGLFMIDAYLGAAVLAVVVMLAVANVALGRAVSEPHRQASGAAAKRRIYERDLVADRANLRCHGLAAGAAARWEQINRPFIAGLYKSGRRLMLGRGALRMIRFASELAVLAGGGALAIAGHISAAALVAAAFLASRALAPLDRLADHAGEARRTAQAFRQMQRLTIEHRNHREDLPEEEPTGMIRLDHVTHIYPGREAPSLSGITLDIRPGECVALSGPAGAGKSTLAAIIAGALLPVEGHISMDGIALGDWHDGDGNNRDMPSPIGYLGDVPFLIDGTIHQNITGFRDVSLLSAAHSCMRTGGHEILSALPGGYQTRITNGGSNLSQRERRAVALARAVHGSRRVVVLDAPEAGLDDHEIDHLVRRLADLNSEGIGFVIASNEPRLQALADRVVMLAEGRLQTIMKENALPLTALAAQASPVPWGGDTADAPGAAFSGRERRN